MVTSLDDLTAAVDQQGFLSLQQQRVLSLSGLVPSGDVGTMYRYRGDRSPFTAIGISGLAPTAPGAGEPPCERARASYVVRRQIDWQGTEQELLELRRKLVEVRFKAAELIRTRLERSVAAGANPPDTARVGDLTASVKSSQDSFDSAWKEVVEAVKRPGLMIIRTDQTRSDSLAGKIGSVLGFGANRDQEVGGFAILAGLRTTFLFLGDDLKCSYWPQPLSEDWNLIGTRFPFVLDFQLPFIGQCNFEDIQIVTTKFEAERVLYVRDQLTEAKLQASLKASVDQLKNAKKALNEVDEVAIEAVLRSVESLGNVGVLGAVKESIEPLDPSCKFCPTTRKLIERVAGKDTADSQASASPAAKNDIEDWGKWHTVYQVLTDYDDLRFMSDRRTRFHLTNFF
jgi:hypothetical protein